MLDKTKDRLSNKKDNLINLTSKQNKKINNFFLIIQNN